LREVLELFRATRLGERVAETGRLSATAVERTVAAAREFLARVPRLPGQRVVGVAAATSALREARNRRDFFRPCVALLGSPPLVLGGEEEAETAFLGACSDRAGPMLTVDIGGGSTELSAGETETCLTSLSVDVGCGRLTEGFGLYEAVPVARAGLARATVRELLAEPLLTLRSAFAPCARPSIVASGGTATTFAAATQQLKHYERRLVHGFRGDEEAVSSLAAELFAAPAAERARHYGIPTDRAAILPAGLLILSEVLCGLGARTFSVTTRGVRFGLCRRLQQGSIEPTWVWDC